MLQFRLRLDTPLDQLCLPVLLLRVHALKEGMLQCLLSRDPLAGQIAEHFQQEIDKILPIRHHVEELVEVCLLVALELFEQVIVEGNQGFVLFCLLGRQGPQDLEYFEQLVSFCFALEERGQ